VDCGQAANGLRGLESGLGGWHHRRMTEPIYIEPKHPAEDTLVAEHFGKKTDWFALIKELRAAYGVSIFDAEKMALAHRGWRLWCNARLATDAHCRVLAWKHIKHHGEIALFVREEDQYRVR